MTRLPLRRLALASALLALLVLPSPSSVCADEDAPTLTVLGARIRPFKTVDAKSKPWDADHGAIPDIVYRQIGGVTGFPPIAILGLIPYRNRPDPFLVVRAGEKEWDRTRPVQGSFSPTWLLTVPLPAGDAMPPVLTLEVFDDDLKDDDRIGKAMLETDSLLAKPGLQWVEGTGGVYDVAIVVRNPAAEGAGAPVEIQLDRIHVKVRSQRPASGDWDVGGNPLKGRLPKRIPMPKRLAGLEASRPDLRLTATWSAGGRKVSVVMDDAFEMDWGDLDWSVEGRGGVGDGLYLEVVDMDLLIADPVGILYVSFEELLAARESGSFVIEPGELNGVERVEITLAGE